MVFEGSLQARIDGHGDERTVALEGEIDLATTGPLNQALDDVLGDRPTVLIVDLTRLTFMDSTGIHALLAAHKRCQDAGCRMVVVVGASHIRRVLEISGVLDLLEVATDPSEGPSFPTGPDDSSPRRG